MTARQALGWRFCALCVPVTLTCAARPWQQVFVAGVAACVIYIIMYRLRNAPLCDVYRSALGKAAEPVLLLTALWALLAAAEAAYRSSNIYGDAPQAQFCPAAILLLAAWTALHPRAGGRCAAVLAPVLAAGFGAFLFSALPQIEPAWICAPPVPGAVTEILAVLLLPTALSFLPAQKPNSVLAPLCLLAAVPAGVSAITVGCLGIEVAAQEPFAFYTLSESLSLFSFVERFEPIVSALSFAAFYALAALLLESAGTVLNQVFPYLRERQCALLCLAGAFTLLVAAPRLPQVAFTISGMLFWGLLPLGTLVIVAAKKDEKNMKKVVDKDHLR